MNIIAFNNLVNWRLFAKLLLIFSIFFFIAGTVEAKTVKRGIQATDLTIAWNIVGGSMTCQGEFSGTQYPNVADGVSAKWKAPHPNANSPLILVKAGSSVLANAGTYVFKCTDAVSGQSDTDSLIVSDCAANEGWNGNTCVLKPVINFSGPATVTSGSKPTLSWIVANATECSIDQSIGSVTPINSGSRVATNAITAATTYTMTCKNGSSGPTDSETVTVGISATPLPTIVKFTGPATVTSGSKPTLSWEVLNASSCTINQSVGTASPTTSGSKEATNAITAATTYRISCMRGPNGPVTKDWTVGISGLPTAPNISLTATPNSITLGDKFTMTGSTDSPLSSCNAWASPVSGSGGWTGDMKSVLEGSYWYLTPTVTGTYNYYIQCTGANGQPSNTANATVTVGGGVAVNGSCGVAARAYGFLETGFVGAMCSTGDLSGSPSFPARGNSVSWVCNGRNGGSPSPTCTASVDDAPNPTFDMNDCPIGEEQNTCWGSATWDLRAGDGPWEIENTTNGYKLTGVASTSAGSLRLYYGRNDGLGKALGARALAVPDWAVASCASPLFWHETVAPSGLCKALPKIVIDPSSSLIRKGKFADIVVKVRATYPTECKVTGGNPNLPSFKLSGSSANPDQSQRITTGPHQATQVVKIECYAYVLPGGSPDIPSSHAATTTRISVLPNYQEL